MALANIRNRPQLFKRVERARFRDLRHANGGGLYMMDDTRPRNRRLQRLNADLGVLALNGNKLRTTRIKLRRTAFVDIHVAFRMTINGGKGRCHCRERQAFADDPVDINTISAAGASKSARRHATTRAVTSSAPYGIAGPLLAVVVPRESPAKHRLRCRSNSSRGPVLQIYDPGSFTGSRVYQNQRHTAIGRLDP